MLERLLTQPVTIHRRTMGGTNADGNPTATYVLVHTIGRIDQVTTDDRAGGDRRVTGWRLYLAPDVTVTGGDRVESGGVIFEIEGDPWLAYTPRGPHHWEVELRQVTP